MTFLVAIVELRPENISLANIFFSLQIIWNQIAAKLTHNVGEDLFQAAFPPLCPWAQPEVSPTLRQVIYLENLDS